MTTRRTDLNKSMMALSEQEGHRGLLDVRTVVMMLEQWREKWLSTQRVLEADAMERRRAERRQDG